MSHLHREIRALEKECDRLKTQFSLNKRSYASARHQISELEHELARLVGQLPVHERELYLIKKEFGPEF